MTTAFDQLQESPATGFARSDFSMDERARVRTLSVKGGSGSVGTATGSFSPVYYLEGDLEAAARVFAEENEAPLSRVDFSRQNIVASSVSQAAYDAILHHVGERVRTVYPTVVREDRRSGVTWVLDREYYETHSDTRYTTGTQSVAKVSGEVSVAEVFSRVGSPILAADLREAGIKGGVEQVLDYYRVASTFDCEPATVEDEIAVVKE
jgi:hypothetical protein